MNQDQREEREAKEEESEEMDGEDENKSSPAYFSNQMVMPIGGCPAREIVPEFIRFLSPFAGPGDVSAKVSRQPADVQHHQVVVSDSEGEATPTGPYSVAVHVGADPAEHADPRKVCKEPALHREYFAAPANDAEVAS